MNKYEFNKIYVYISIRGQRMRVDNLKKTEKYLVQDHEYYITIQTFVVALSGRTLFFFQKG